MEVPEQHGQDLTTGNITKQLWSMAWPIMLSIFFYTLYNIVDTIWVGKLSAESIAAVSISQIALFAMMALGMGITVGSGVLIGNHIGAKEHDEAERVLAQSFVLSTVLGLIFTGIALLFRDTILIFSGASGDVFAPAQSYFTIVASGAVLSFVMMNVVFAYNAQGDSFTPTKLFAISTLVNVVLDPVLIFGWGGVPSLGVAGAAYATLVSQALFIVIAMYMLMSERQMVPLRLAKLSFVWSSVKRVLRIGIPAALTQVIQPVGLAALMYITAQSFYELGTVAFSVAFRIEFLAYLPAIGFGFGSMALIGQSMGAGKPERAQAAYNTALRYGAITAGVVGVVALLASKPLVSIFTTDPLVIEYVRGYLLIVGLSYMFLAAALVQTTVFQAMDQSWSGFWLYVIRLACVSIPIAFVATTYFETTIDSIWWALAIGNVCGALVGYFWVKRLFTTQAAALETVKEM